MIFKNKTFNKNLFTILPYVYVVSSLIYIFFSSALCRYSKLDLESISIIMAALGIVGLLIYVSYKIINKIKFDVFDFLVCLLGVLGIISTLFAINKQVSLMGFWGRYEGLLQIYFYYVLFLNCGNMQNEKKQKNITNMILIMILVQGIYAILQFYDVKNLFGIEVLRNRYYSNGFQSNPNFLGSLMVIGFSFSISVYFFKNNFKNNLLWLILTFLMFMGLLTSGTMSAVVSVFVLVFILIILFIILKCNLRTIIIKSLIVIIVFFCGYKIYSYKDNGYLTTQINKTANEINLTVKGEAKDIFGTGRIYIWRNALSVVPENFLTGVGIDNFFYAFGEKKLMDIKSGLIVDKAHNEYLQKLVAEGVLSLLTYLVLLGTIFIKSCIKIFKERENTNYILIALFLGFFAYSIQAFFNISVISVAPIYYIIAGLLVSKIKEVENE